MQTTSSEIPVQQASGLPTVTAIDKSDVSPILKQTLTLNLSAAYSITLQREDLDVKLVNDDGYSRDLYIMSVNEAAKTFTVKFNGAPLGEY